MRSRPTPPCRGARRARWSSERYKESKQGSKLATRNRSRGANRPPVSARVRSRHPDPPLSWNPLLNMSRSQAGAISDRYSGTAYSSSSEATSTCTRRRREQSGFNSCCIGVEEELLMWALDSRPTEKLPPILAASRMPRQPESVARTGHLPCREVALTTCSTNYLKGCEVTCTKKR